MIPLFLLPLCLLPMLVSKFYKNDEKKNPEKSISIVLILMLAFLLFKVASLGPGKKIYSDYYPKDAQAIDKVLKITGARHGIAHYWQCKRLPLLLKEDVILAQTYKSLCRHGSVISKRWYRDCYNFALVDNVTESSFKFNKEKLMAINGPPTAIYKCGTTDFYYYKDGMYTSAADNK